MDAYGASYEYSEYEMSYDGEPEKETKSTDSDFILELAKDKDIPQLIELEEELYEKKIKIDEYPKPEEEIQQDFYIYLVKVAQKVVGKVAIQFEEDAHGKKSAGIYGVGIFKKNQGNGYGKKLLKEAVAIVQKNNRNHIILQVDSTNEIAHKMYQKFGFKEVYTMDYYAFHKSQNESITSKGWTVWNQ